MMSSHRVQTRKNTTFGMRSCYQKTVRAATFLHFHITTVSVNVFPFRDAQRVCAHASVPVIVFRILGSLPDGFRAVSIL